jgi:hypothetical protein
VAEGSKWCVAFLDMPGHAAPLAAFSRDTRKPDGRAKVCRACQSAYRKAQYVPRPRVRRAVPSFSPARVNVRTTAPVCRLEDVAVCRGALAPCSTGALLCQAHNQLLDQIAAGDVPQRRRVA